MMYYHVKFDGNMLNVRCSITVIHESIKHIYTSVEQVVDQMVLIHTQN